VLSKPLEPNNCCRTFLDNVLNLIKWDKPIDPPSSLVQASEEERLKTSNTPITNKEALDHSNPVIDLTISETIPKEIAFREIALGKTGLAISIQPMHQGA